MNTCPVCGEELRSETALKCIAGYRAEIEACMDKILKREKAEADKQIYCFGSVIAYLG